MTVPNSDTSFLHIFRWTLSPGRRTGPIGFTVSLPLPTIQTEQAQRPHLQQTLKRCRGRTQHPPSTLSSPPRLQSPPSPLQRVFDLRSYFSWVGEPSTCSRTFGAAFSELSLASTRSAQEEVRSVSAHRTHPRDLRTCPCVPPSTRIGRSTPLSIWDTYPLSPFHSPGANNTEALIDRFCAWVRLFSSPHLLQRISMMALVSSS